MAILANFTSLRFLMCQLYSMVLNCVEHYIFESVQVCVCVVPFGSGSGRIYGLYNHVTIFQEDDEHYYNRCMSGVHGLVHVGLHGYAQSIN